MILRKNLYGAFLACLCAVTACGGGAWQLKARVVDRSQGHVSTSEVPILFTQRHLKIGLPGNHREKSDLLHDRQTGICRLVNHGNRSYAQINTKAVSAVGDAARTIEGAIRKGVGKITGKPPAPKPTLRVDRSEQLQMVAGIPCYHFRVLCGDTLVQEIWATSWRQAGIEKENTEALRELAKAMDQPALTSLLGLTTDGKYSLTESILQIDGYPVIFVQHENGKPICQVRLEKPKRADASADAFRCPSSYRLRLPAMP